MSGRALRPWPGKENCSLLEFVDKGGHSLIQIGNVPGVVPPNGREAVGDGEIVSEVRQLKGDDGYPVEELLIGTGVYSTALNLLGRSPLDWVVEGRRAVLGLGNGQTLLILPPQDAAGQKRLQARIQQGKNHCQKRPDDAWAKARLARLMEQKEVADTFALYLVSKEDGVRLLLGDEEYSAILDRATEYAEDHGTPQIYQRRTHRSRCWKK